MFSSRNMKNVTVYLYWVRCLLKTRTNHDKIEDSIKTFYGKQLDLSTIECQ